MKILIGAGSLTDFTNSYIREAGALRIDDTFDNTTRKATCTFTLIDLDSPPVPGNVVEVYHNPPDDDLILFSGVVKTVTKRIVASYGDDSKPNLIVYDIVADSWEVEGSNYELVTYEEYYSKTIGYIVKDIVDKYLPHLSSANLSDAGPVFERVVISMRRPNEIITALCDKAGWKWWVNADKTVECAVTVGTSDPSPLIIDNASNQVRQIGLEVVENIESRVNDLFMRSKSIRGALVQEMIPVDGFTGNYPLKQIPWGLDTVVPIIDEFAGGDVPTYPDDNKWKVLDPTLGDHDNFTLQDGRLQISKGGTAGALISRQLVSTLRTFEMRDLEAEFTSFDFGSKFIMGLHTGETSTDVTKFPLAIQIEPTIQMFGTANVRIRKGAVVSDAKYTVNLLTKDPTPYQFRIVVTFAQDDKTKRQYYIYVQDPTELAKGSAVYTLIDSGTFEAGALPAYVAFVPAYTSGGVEGTVIQGSVSLKPDFYVGLEEMQFISGIGEKDTVYINCEHANWSKWILGDAKQGLTVIFYDTAGTEYATNPNTGLPFRILRNTSQQLVLYSTPSDSWFTSNNIIKLKIQRRWLTVSNSQANDYTTHAVIEVQQGTPILSFFQEEIPCGWLNVEYWADQPKTLEIYDEDAIAEAASDSGIVGDTGRRKQYEALDDSIQTVFEMLTYGKQFLDSQGAKFVEGTVETETGVMIPNTTRIRAGMDQVIDDLELGSELIDNVTTFISRVSIEHVGNVVLKYTITLGNIKDVLKEWYIAKLNDLHASEMFIDDLSAEEPPLAYDDVVEIDDIASYGAAPIFYNFYFDGDGITLRWYTLGDYDTVEIRTDKAYGTDGAGLMYRGIGTELVLTGASITRRKYTFYAYGIDSRGVYTKMPNECTVENKQPTTTPLRDILVDNNAVVTVALAMPYEDDVTKRIIYVNNAPTSDDDLADSDMVIELQAWEIEAKFIAYDSTLYVTLVEEDTWSATLDTKRIRFDRIVHTGIVARPPKEPTGFSVKDYTEDTQLQQCQVKLHIPYAEDPEYGLPEVFHVQFGSDTSWPDPNAGLPNGIGTGILEQACGNTVKLPLNALSALGSDPTIYLLVLHTTFVTSEGTKDWYQGRWISTVTNDTVNDIVTVNGQFFMDAADDYDWQIWGKWFLDPSVDGGYQDFTVTPDSYSFVQNEYQFVREMADFIGYARVYAVNKYGLIGPIEDVQVFSTTRFPVDVTPAPLVENLVVTADGFTLPDGSQKVLLNIGFDAPNPEENYSHIILFADRPSEGVPGKEGETGWRGDAGFYKEILGEVWDAGDPIPVDPSAVASASTIYAVSVNKHGYYPADWATTGEGHLGGYVSDTVVITPEDTAPPASSEVTATYVPGGGIVVVWDTISIVDMANWEIEEKTATTEGGLSTAEWVAVCETLSTYYNRQILTSENSYWFQFRVRAVDNAGNLGTWAESNAVQGYMGGSVVPVAAPTNLSAAGAWEYRIGVPIAYIAVNWDNPADPNYGGCEVWVVYSDHGEMYDRVGYLSASSSKINIVMNGQSIKVRLVPYNRGGVVPSYDTYVESSAATLSPATFGETVPAPDIVARDNIGSVDLHVEVPAWAGMTNPYSGVAIYLSGTNNSANAHLIGKFPVSHASGTSEKVSLHIPFSALETADGGPYSEGTLYYFFGKMESKTGAQSGFSVDTDHSAMFLSGATIDDGKPDFADSDIVMVIVTNDLLLTVGWNTPTIHGTTVYMSHIQVARDTSFTDIVWERTINASTATDIVGLPVNGTYYVRVRYYNHSQEGVSDWFGLKGAAPAYATVTTHGGSSGDTSYIDGATYLTGYYDRIEQSDAFRVYFKMSSAATNCATWWNTTVLWSATESKLNDNNYVITPGLTLGWADNDGWIAVSAISASWLNRLLQWKKHTSPDLYVSGIITDVDVANSKVRINTNWGAAKSGQSGRVVSPYWERNGVWFEEVRPPDGAAVFLKNVNYYMSTIINQIPSPATIYFKMIPNNAVFGPGTAETFNVSTQQKALDVITKTLGYANDTVPVATFSSAGYDWDVAASNSVDLLVSFRLTHQSPIDPLETPDSIVIVAKIGTSAPTDVNDSTNTRKFVFPITHNSSYKDYLLKCPGFDPFTAYSYTVWHAKTCANGMVVGTDSTIRQTNVKYTTGSNLVLAPLGVSGLVKILNNSKTDYGAMELNQILFHDPDGNYCSSIWQNGSAGGLRISFTTPQVDPESELQITHVGSEIRLYSSDGNIIRAYDAPMQASMFIADSSGYTAPFIMGNYYLWVNAKSGKLYIKNGAPTSDTDGTIVGTQS